MSSTKRPTRDDMSRFAWTTAAFLASAAFCGSVAAQAYPSRPVKLIAPYAPGGPLDEVARVVSPRLTESLGQPVVVENRAGAGGDIGTDFVAKSAPDGYTVLLGNGGPITINPALKGKLPYDPQKDLAPVTLAVSSPMVMVVHPSLPVKTVKDLVRLAKANPGRLNYASAGIGNLPHLGMESLQAVAGMKMVHSPYKGVAPAFVDLLSGQIDLMFANVVGILPHIKTGKVRAVAVSSAKRSSVLPEVPSVAESGYSGFDITGWMGFFVPAATPKELVARLNGEIARILQRQDVKERFASRGADVIASTPEELGSFIKKEGALYAKVIKDLGIRPE